MDVIETSTTDEFVRTASQWISAVIRQATENGRNTVVGLAGGSTPQPVYAALAADASLPWDRIRFFLVDERYVPPDHRESNQRMIRAALLTGVAAEAGFIAPDTTLPLKECIESYGTLVQGLKPDLVILGMGPDGHIASLFPPLKPEAFGPTSIIHTTTDRFAVRDRISVTLPILERSNKRLFLITGPEKQALFRHMQHQTQDVTLHPAVALFDERTTWIRLIVANT